MDAPHHRHYRLIILASLAVCIIVYAFHSRNTQNQGSQQGKTVVPRSVSLKQSVIDKNILIPEEPITQKSASTTIQKDANTITSESYLVGNLQTGKIYLQKNISRIFPIASLSKLFTALVVVHILNPDQAITMTDDILNTFGDAGHLAKDEKFFPRELLYPLLLESSNDAAEAYAQSFGYKKFIDYMNSFALEIGMNTTSFKDSSGLSPANSSSARDLFTLAQYLYKHEPSLLEITRQKTFDLATTTEHGSHHFVSINPFVFYAPFIGGKTGRTEEARESMVSLFNVQKGTQSYPVAVILLRSDFGQREIDTEKILDRFLKTP